MKETKGESHEFAIYTEAIKYITKLKELDTLEISDKELYHRAIKVLRLQQDNRLILFNENFNIPSTISTINKHTFSIKIKQILQNKQLTPKVYWLLPLLKKEAFEDCLYALTEMGVQEIYPIITQKSQQAAHYLGSDRIKNIMITAAEQAKQFNIPRIHAAQPLDKTLQKLELPYSKIFFDPTGSPFFDSIKSLKQKEETDLVCAIGPEGDLTTVEKELLKNHNFEFCKLTETVLRAKQAVNVATGILRSLL